MKLLFTNEWLRKKIANDPDLPCEAGDESIMHKLAIQEIKKALVNHPHYAGNAAIMYIEELEDEIARVKHQTSGDKPVTAAKRILTDYQLQDLGRSYDNLMREGKHGHYECMYRCFQLAAEMGEKEHERSSNVPGPKQPPRPYDDKEVG